MRRRRRPRWMRTSRRRVVASRRWRRVKERPCGHCLKESRLALWDGLQGRGGPARARWGGEYYFCDGGRLSARVAGGGLARRAAGEGSVHPGQHLLARCSSCSGLRGRRSSAPLAAYLLPRGRRGRRRACLRACLRQPRPLPERRAELRRPWGPRNSLAPSEGAGLRRTPRAPHFPSHSGHSSDRWSSDPGDAPRA